MGAPDAATSPAVQAPARTTALGAAAELLASWSMALRGARRLPSSQGAAILRYMWHGEGAGSLSQSAPEDRWPEPRRGAQAEHSRPHKMPAQLRRLAAHMSNQSASQDVTREKDADMEGESISDDEPAQHDEKQEESSANAVKLAKAAVLLREAGKTEEADRIQSSLEPVKTAVRVNMDVAYQQAIRHRAKVQKHLEAVKSEQADIEKALQEIALKREAAEKEFEQAEKLVEEAHRTLIPAQPLRAEPPVDSGTGAAALETKLRAVAARAQVDADDLERKYAGLLDTQAKGGPEAPGRMGFLLEELIAALIGGSGSAPQSAASQSRQAPATPNQNGPAEERSGRPARSRSRGREDNEAVDEQRRGAAR